MRTLKFKNGVWIEKLIETVDRTTITIFKKSRSTDSTQKIMHENIIPQGYAKLLVEEC
jgi:hypothetical protein